MTRRIAALLFAPTLALSLLACSSDPTPFDDVDVVGRDTNPEGLLYPTQDLGARPRSASRPGQRIPNFSFQGYPNSQRDKGLQVVSLADYYDPGQSHHKLLFWVAVVGWCPHCQAETRDIVARDSSLRSQCLEVVQTLMEGMESDRPLALIDVDDWVGQMHTDFTVLIDVEGRRLGAVANLAGVPWNAVIDTRSMEVLRTHIGELDDLPAYLQEGLDWVNRNPARP